MKLIICHMHICVHGYLGYVNTCVCGIGRVNQKESEIQIESRLH